MASTNPKLRLIPFDPLDTVTVSAPRLSDLYSEGFARPVDFVTTWQEPRAPGGGESSGGGYSSGLPGSEPLPVLDIENPPEIEVNAPRIPLEDLSDAELLEIGTDSAYYELDLRQGNPNPGEMILRQAPNLAFVPDPRFMPSIYPAVEIIATWLRAIPLFGLLIPGPGGKSNEVDDLPLDWRAPPKAPPPGRPFSLDPIQPPNWNDSLDWDTIPLPFGVPQPVFKPEKTYRLPVDHFPFPVTWPIGDPIGDPDGRFTTIPGYPGILEPFNDPIPWPELQPFRTPEPNPFRDPSPFVVPATPTNPGLAPRRIADPFPDPATRPITRPGAPDPFGFPIGDPVTTAPPRVVAPPSPLAPGVGQPNPFDPFTPIGNPFADPLPFADPAPYRADPCNCAATKEKKKPKGKKKPRAICYKGSYRETRNSLQKKPRERIPC